MTTTPSTSSSTSATKLRIGWGQVDITPTETVFVAGQFGARVSEGVLDPLSVTALALDSGDDQVVFVTIDIVGLTDELVAAVRTKSEGLQGLDTQKLVISVTHTHTGPETRIYKFGIGNISSNPGFQLDAMNPADYVDFLTTRVAEAVKQAWTSRVPGKVAYGMTHAVIGRNRRWASLTGENKMYGDTTKPEFSHVEGYEDPTINVLATYDTSDKLIGVVVNTACPSQVTENLYQLSADFWHETRLELRERLGEKLFILPQCSSAGDQAPRPIWGKGAEERMLKLKGRSQRQEIANRLANAVEDVLPAIAPTATGDLALTHRIIKLDVPLNKLTQADADDALINCDKHMKAYEAQKAVIEANPEMRKEPRWYYNATGDYRRGLWYRGVAQRFEQYKNIPTSPQTIHVLRLGDMALATQPYEYYLDYGIRIKARSPAAQTFLLQLVGNGTYCPSDRSLKGGGYGSVPASNVVGPEAGKLICEESLKAINALWA